MEFRLEILDYVLISSALVLSTVIGLYYGVFKKKNNSVEEYFLASRELSPFAMTCSMFATILSSGAMVGVVAEIYYYGSQPIIGFSMFILAQHIYIKFFFPVFFKIGNHDLYTYYELRFSKHIRWILSFLTVVEKTFSSSIVIYGTAIVLSGVSGMHTWTLISIITTICVLYSSLGGVRGVTLADMIQAFVIILSVLAVCILGIVHIGGITELWQRNWNSGRLNIFRFDFNPETRHTFWTATIGQFFTSMSIIGTSQIVVLRMMGSGRIDDCRKASLYGTVTSNCVFLLCSFIGLLIYAYYHLCDPVLSGAIRSPNQLLSIYVGNELSIYTGLAGIFFAGFVCAAVSTLSSNFNGVAALVMETFVKPLNFIRSDQAYTTLAKAVVVVLGALALLGIIAVEQFPNIYQASIVIRSVTDGPHLALLLIGILFPQASFKSSVAGFGSGLAFMLWLVAGSIVIKPISMKMPISTTGCTPINITNANFSHWTTAIPTFYENSTIETGFINSTISTILTVLPAVITTVSWANYFPLSSVSFNWFCAIGTTVTLIIFALISLIFGADRKRPINFDLIPEPLQNIQKKLSKRWQTFLLCDIYSKDFKADQELTVFQSEKLMEESNPIA